MDTCTNKYVYVYVYRYIYVTLTEKKRERKNDREWKEEQHIYDLYNNRWFEENQSRAILFGFGIFLCSTMFSLMVG